MHHQAQRLFSVTRGLIYIELFLLPIFFLPFTLDRLDLNKQTLLLVLTFAAALTWFTGMMMEKRFMFRRGWVNVLPVLLLIAVGVSALNSSAPFLSWVGGSLQEYTSFLTMSGLVVLFYLVTNVLHDQPSRLLHALLLLSALIVGALGILSLFGIGLNTIGTINATGVYLSIMAIFASALFVTHKRDAWENVLIPIFLVTTFAYLLIVDYWILWLLFVLGHVLLFTFVFFRPKNFPSHTTFILPIVLTVLSLPFWFWISSPIPVKPQTEVTPSFGASMEIAKRSFDHESQSFGSGPGTYVFVYGREHGPQVNQTEFFNTRFDRAASLVLTLLPTIGYLGVIAFLVFLFALGVRAIFHELIATSVLFPAWLTLIVAAALYPFNLTLMWLLFLLSALLASQVLSKPTTPSSKRAILVRFISAFALGIGSLAFLIGIFFTSQRYFAEIAFAKAVRADREGTELSKIVESLDRAATLNRYDDRVYRNLAQVLLLRVNEQLKGVSSATELTEESRSYVQALVASSVNAAVRATELSPENSLNWMMRGALYRELVNLVPNASTFAISAFERAIELEPLNPVNWNELGITYLATAERERPLTASSDKEAAKQAFALVEDYMKKAEAAFSKAIELKLNFAPAHYQLGLAYERAGRLDEAIGKMESVAKYNALDVGVAFQLGQLYMRRAKSGDLDRAKKSFEYAISLAPSYSNARWFLTTIYEKQGDIASATEQLAKILQLNPDNQLVKSRLERLQKGQTTSETGPLP